MSKLSKRTLLQASGWAALAAAGVSMPISRSGVGPLFAIAM